MSSQPAGTIDVGAVFARVLNTYAKIWRTLTVGALIVFAPIAVLLGIIVASESGGAAFLVVALAVVGTFWYQGMVVETVRDVQDGTLDSNVGQLFRSATPVLGSLIAVGFLATVGVLIGFVLLIVPGLILLTIWAVVAPVVVIERKGAVEAFGRSRELVRGNGWQVFGVLVALFALNIALSIVVSVIGAAGVGAAIVAQLAQYLVFAPVSALAAAIIYFALREAHGDSVLAQPTGVLSGGFVPPVPPTAADDEAGWPAPQPPAAAEPPATEPPAAAEPPAAEPPATSYPAVAPIAPITPAPAVAEAPTPEPQPANLPAESAFGTPQPAESDAFGQPDAPADDEQPPPPPAVPRDPDQSVAPPGWTPPAGQ